MARPYQPSLLRLVHACAAVLVPVSWLSGWLVYNNFDGRWGRLPAIPGDWINWHGSVALLALLWCVGTGKLMEEDWLRDGQLQHSIYGLHLLGWCAIALAVAWHLWGVLQRGGPALAAAMWSAQLAANDQPRHWPGQLLRQLRGSPSKRGRPGGPS